MADTFSGKPLRRAGLLVPVFSIRREEDLGIGDVAGLREFVDFAADRGFGFVQLLPINETGPDNSPYNAISSVALDPGTLDCSPEGLVDLSEAEFQRIAEGFGLDKLRSGPVDHAAVRRLKGELLRSAFGVFAEEHYEVDTERGRDFQAFCERESAWINDYCVFRAIMERQGGAPDWQKWDEELRTLDGARAFVSELYEKAPRETDLEVTYFAYVQWTAYRQWRGVAEHAAARGVLLMGDIPYGVSVASADVFSRRGIFDLDWYGGAPPEQLFKDDEFVQKWGQNWGIPLYDWEALEAEDYAWWRQRIRKTVEIFGLFRVDHALGFYRIYSFPWNPVRNEEFLPLEADEAAERCGGRRPGFRPRPDDSEENVRANRADGEKTLRMIQEAADGAEVIAEDLGMVPDYVRPSLETIGMAGTRVPQWEFGEGKVLSGLNYPALSFATYATHDHAPLAAQWEEARRKVEKCERESLEWWDGENLLRALCDFAGIHAAEDRYPEYGREVQEKLLRELCFSNSRLVSLMISDLLGSEERINVPGVADGSNWSYRLAPTVTELAESEEWEWMRTMCDRITGEGARVTG